MVKDEGMAQEAVKKWLSDNELDTHHFKESQVQLAPDKLHGGVAHAGGASALRDGQVLTP